MRMFFQLTGAIKAGVIVKVSQRSSPSCEPGDIHVGAVLSVNPLTQPVTSLVNDFVSAPPNITLVLHLRIFRISEAYTVGEHSHTCMSTTFAVHKSVRAAQRGSRSQPSCKYRKNAESAE